MLLIGQLCQSGSNDDVYCVRRDLLLIALVAWLAQKWALKRSQPAKM